MFVNTLFIVPASDAGFLFFQGDTIARSFPLASF